MTAAIVACGDPAARVSLVPVGGGSCGAPADGTGLKVTAFGAHGPTTRALGLDQTVSIDDFPSDTIAIGVEVLGADGDVAIGKTAPLDFDALADGSTIPIFMAPPGGACQLPDLGTPRTRPLVAVLGSGVLIVGGIGPDGPLGTAELYDPATATFHDVDVPTKLVDDTSGLEGGVLTTLPDGQVVLTGTATHAIAIFDPGSDSFTQVGLGDSRALHAALAIDDTHLLVTGGCNTVDVEACSGVVEHSTKIYELPDDTNEVGGAVLGSGDARINGALYDLGPRSSDGAELYAFPAGEPEPGRTARFAFADANAEDITGLPARVVALDGGALLGAFGSDGDPPTGSAAILAPGTGTAATPIASAPIAQGARLVALQEGRVLALGGTADGSVAIYDPTLGAWAAHIPGGDSMTDGGSLVSPTLLRLVDGSVLVLGAPIAPGDPSHAWIYRPSIVGPEAGLVNALPDGSVGVLTPPDPTRVTARTNGSIELTAPAVDDAALPARLLVGGPHTATGSVSAIVGPGSGEPMSGVALIAQELGPGRALIARLVPGQLATIARVDLAHSGASCTGDMVAALPMSTTTLALAVQDNVATVTQDGTAIATCPLDGDPDLADVGVWGVAAAGSGSVIEVLGVTVSR